MYSQFQHHRCMPVCMPELDAFRIDGSGYTANWILNTECGKKKRRRGIRGMGKSKWWRERTPKWEESHWKWKRAARNRLNGRIGGRDNIHLACICWLFLVWSLWFSHRRIPICVPMFVTLYIYASISSRIRRLVSPIKIIMNVFFFFASSASASLCNFTVCLLRARIYVKAILVQGHRIKH